MATAVTMPKLGLAMTEGQVVKWLKQDGEQVEKGELVVVVMTKKITYEVEAPASGILRIVAYPKETRPVGGVIGFILAPGEAMPEIEEEAPPPPAPPEETPRAVRSSPAARRLARELGVDITWGQGSGAVDLINVVAVAMLSEVTVGELMRFIPAHPSIGEAMVDAAMDVEKRSLHLPKW